MSKLLTKDQLLQEILKSLVRAYGRAAVASALDQIAQDRGDRESGSKRTRRGEPEEPNALKTVQGLLPLPNGDLLRRFAEDYDRGEALPKTADIRRFLAAHRVNPADLKSRNQAFRLILPLLCRMSEKNLLKVINRASFSGLAQLDDIADAIRGTGQDIRHTQSD